MAFYNNSFLALFYLTPQELERVVRFQNNKMNPFTGLFALEESQKPVAIRVEGSNNTFTSNRVMNMYSFSVDPNASFIILDHIQEGKDEKGNAIKYKVDFALVLGMSPDEEWDSLAIRIIRLFDTFITLRST